MGQQALHSQPDQNAPQLSRPELRWEDRPAVHARPFADLPAATPKLLRAASLWLEMTSFLAPGASRHSPGRSSWNREMDGEYAAPVLAILPRQLASHLLDGAARQGQA